VDSHSTWCSISLSAEASVCGGDWIMSAMAA
jgi:hypothetical protein